MKTFRRPFTGLLFYTMPFWVECGTNDEPRAPVSLTWEMDASGIEPGYYENSFVLKNIPGALLSKDQAIYYSQPPYYVKQEGTLTVRVEAVNGNFFKIYPTDDFMPSALSDSMRITFLCSYKSGRNSHVSEGTYWVVTTGDKEDKPLPVVLSVLPLPSLEVPPGHPDTIKICASNLRLDSVPVLKQWDGLPSVRKVTPVEGHVILDVKVALTYPDEYAGEAKLLKEKLATLYGLEVADEAPVMIALEELSDKVKAMSAEYYNSVIEGSLIKITAATPHGILSGTQTLLSIPKSKAVPHWLETMFMEDYPDFLYRRQVTDIARNFTAVDNLKKLIDTFASYEMNVLHFHFVDDEVWCLDIPGLGELIAVESHRGYTVDESRCLHPCYDGRCDPDTATVGNGHYSREGFIGLLRYAAERHIRVIPEVESPGHARAIIVSVKARYNKYKEVDMAKTTEYLLSEPEDTSRCESVQYYTDNVISVALSSPYRFMKKVIRELTAMYKEAGVPLSMVRLGDNGVVHGVWLGSLKCMTLMKEKGMTKPHDLAEYLVAQMADIMQKSGLRFGGWQKMVLGHTEEARRQLKDQAAGVYCWNAVPGYEEVVYRIVNDGYPVILCSVDNFHADMAYNGYPDRCGLDWGDYVDEAVSFSILPFSIYRSLRTGRAGNPVDLEQARRGETALTAVDKKNIPGVRGQLSTETIRSFDGAEYLLFPKIMGLAEHGWNAYPAWESLQGAQEQRTFDKALALYYEEISETEIPYWVKNGINLRLPHPRLLVRDGKLYANAAIQDTGVCYTMDGPKPTVQSTLRETPVGCDTPVVKAKTFYQGRESLPIILKTE